VPLDDVGIALLVLTRIPDLAPRQAVEPLEMEDRYHAVLTGMETRGCENNARVFMEICVLPLLLPLCKGTTLAMHFHAESNFGDGQHVQKRA
jgi:hypothetical protein